MLPVLRCMRGLWLALAADIALNVHIFTSNGLLTAPARWQHTKIYALLPAAGLSALTHLFGI